MNRIISIIIILFLPIFLVAQSKELNQYINRFQYSKALEKIRTEFINPTSDELILISNIYNKLNLPDSALLTLNKIPANNQDYRYLIQKAMSYSLLNNQAELKIVCDQLFSIGIKNRDTKVTLKIAEVFSNKKFEKTQIALDLLEKIQESESSNSEFYQVKANTFININKFGAAITELQRATFYDSLNPYNYYMLGKIYTQNRNFPLAIDYLNKSLAKDSLFYPSYKELGNIYYDLNKNSKALEYFEKYCNNNEVSITDSLKLSSMYLLNKQYSEAELINKRIYNSNPNNVYCLRLNAYINCETDKNISEGINSIEKFFKLADTSVIITSDYEYKGRLYSKAKNDSIAIINYNMALKIDSTHIGNYEFIAKSYENLKQNNIAAIYYEKFINKKENPLPSDYFFMGRNYYISASKPLDSLSKRNNQLFISDSLEKIQYLIKADTAFGTVINLSANSHLGYFWKARVKAMFDPETTQGLALPFYTKALSIIESKPDKYKKEIIESCKYIGYFYFLQYENYQKTDLKDKISEMKALSLQYWRQIIALDSEDKVAIEAIKNLSK